MSYEELCLNIGLNIKFFRQQKHITQAVLSEMLDIDIRDLSDIERGKKNITLKTLYRISAALNINPVDFFVYTRAQQEN